MVVTAQGTFVSLQFLPEIGQFVRARMGDSIFLVFCHNHPSNIFCCLCMPGTTKSEMGSRPAEMGTTLGHRPAFPVLISYTARVAGNVTRFSTYEYSTPQLHLNFRETRNECF